VLALQEAKLLALLATLPFLTLVSDVSGIIDGGAVATKLYGQPMETIIASVLRGIEAEDIAGFIKPFALITGNVLCQQCMKTYGGLSELAERRQGQSCTRPSW